MYIKLQLYSEIKINIKIAEFICTCVKVLPYYLVPGN